MDPFSTLETWLNYLNLAGDVAVVLALAGRKLARVYRILLLYFLVDLLASLLGLGFDRRYAYQAYYVGQAVKWILAFWFILDLYGRVLAPHPALAKFGRAAVGVLLAVAVAVSLPGFLLELYRPYDPDLNFFLFSRFERTADSAVAILLLLISAFLVWYPVKMRRNVVSYLAGFTVYFTVRAVGLTAMDWWRIYFQQVDAAVLAVALGCMVFWAVVMRPEGETQTVSGHGWNPQEAERLSLQLDHANEWMARLLRGGP